MTVLVEAVYVTLAVLAGTLMQEHAEVMRDAGYDAPFVTQLGGATVAVLGAMVALTVTALWELEEATMDVDDGVGLLFEPSVTEVVDVTVYVLVKATIVVTKVAYLSKSIIS